MATIGIGEDGEYADGFIRPVKEQIRVPFDDPRIHFSRLVITSNPRSPIREVPMIVGKVATYRNVLISALLPSVAI